MFVVDTWIANEVDKNLDYRAPTRQLDRIAQSLFALFAAAQTCKLRLQILHILSAGVQFGAQLFQLNRSRIKLRLLGSASCAQDISL